MVYLDSEIREINNNEEIQILNLVEKLLESHKDKLRVNDIKAAVRVIHKAAEETIHSVNIFGSDIEEERIIKELKDMLCTYLVKPGFN